MDSKLLSKFFQENFFSNILDKNEKQFLADYLIILDHVSYGNYLGFDMSLKELQFILPLSDKVHLDALNKLEEKGLIFRIIIENTEITDFRYSLSFDFYNNKFNAITFLSKQKKIIDADTLVWATSWFKSFALNLRSFELIPYNQEDIMSLLKEKYTKEEMEDQGALDLFFYENSFSEAEVQYVITKMTSYILETMSFIPPCNSVSNLNEIDLDSSYQRYLIDKEEIYMGLYLILRDYNLIRT